MKHLSLMVLVVLGAFYLYLCPDTIQGGDTPELVMAGFHRLVPHPPGYPLYVWLQHIWTHIFQVSSVFWRASVLTGLFGVGALYFIFRPLFHSWIGPVLLVTLGLQSLMIENSILPDVFSLHALLVALIAWFFFDASEKIRSFWLPLVCALGFANHHTIVFLFPCFVYCFWEIRKSPDLRKRFMVGSVVGVMLVTGLTLSLFLCQPEHLLSWGSLQTPGDLLRHFLRATYGTFNLQPETGNESHGFDAYISCLKELSTLFLPMGALLWFMRNSSLEKDGRLWTWTLVMFFSISFFLLTNVAPVGVGSEILRRFYLLPFLCGGVWIVQVLARLNLDRKKLLTFSAFLLPLIYTFSKDIPGLLQLKNDTVIEDYAKNFLREAEAKAPALILTDTDTAVHAVHYLQSMTPVSGVASSGLLLLSEAWNQEKIKRIFPDFRVPVKNHGTRTEINFNDFMKENMDKMNIFTSRYGDEEHFLVTFMGLGRILKPGVGTRFGDETVNLRTRLLQFPRGPQSFTKAILYYQYAHRFLARAYVYTLEKNTALAVKEWEAAVKFVPYALPAMMNLCSLTPDKYPFCDKAYLMKLHDEVKGVY